MFSGGGTPGWAAPPAGPPRVTATRVPIPAAAAAREPSWSQLGADALVLLLAGVRAIRDRGQAAWHALPKRAILATLFAALVFVYMASRVGGRGGGWGWRRTAAGPVELKGGMRRGSGRGARQLLCVISSPHQRVLLTRRSSPVAAACRCLRGARPPAEDHCRQLKDTGIAWSPTAEGWSLKLLGGAASSCYNVTGAMPPLLSKAHPTPRR